MVMSITFALQQKHQDEQNRLCSAGKLLMQSPGYTQVFEEPPPPFPPTRTFFFLIFTLLPILIMDSTLVRRRHNVTRRKVCIIAY